MIINISKSYDIEDSDLQFSDRKNILKNDWIENLNAPIEERADFPDSLCMYYYRSIEQQDIPVVKLINAMLSNGLNSPLYQEIREKRALCYQVGSYIHELGKLPLVLVAIMTSPDKSEIAHNTLKEVFENKDTHMTEERLDTIRKSLQISKKKKMINRHDNINDILDENVNILNTILDDIKLEEILNVYDKYFNIESFTKVDDKNF